MEYLEQAVWTLPATKNDFSRWAAGQVALLCEALCGRTPDILSPPEAATHGFSIVAGCESNNHLIAEAIKNGVVNLDDVGSEGFASAWHDQIDRATLYIAGTDPSGAVYGIFAFFESLGCRFEISGDLMPETAESVPVPRVLLRGVTANRWRGFYFQYCFATNALMSLVDYERMFDQMAKMRLNTICYYYFPNEPFIDYTFRGERKLVGDISNPDSGYMSYGRHFSGSYRVADIPIGKELFDRGEVAPLEFQKVGSSEAALDAGTRFLNRLISLASERGIRTWISFLPTFVTPNFAKYLRRMPRPHLHWSALVSATDPTLDEINRCRLQSILANYPGLHGVFCGIPEGYFEDPYQESQELVAKRLPEFGASYEIHRDLWGDYWNRDEAILKDHIKRDICFTEIVSRTLTIARELDPEIGLGVMMVCKAYLGGYLDNLLPKDIVFADIESRSLWTKSGAPLHLFQEIQGRECVVVPRAVDDGSMAGLQFNLGRYDQDRFLKSVHENGTDGLLVQLTHIRGNEHNTRFLATGMWDDSITPESFYADYATAIMPGAVDKLREAFAIFDEMETYLGGRGLSNMPWNKVPLHIEILRSFKDHQTPFWSVSYGQSFLNTCAERSEKYAGAIDRLGRALTILATIQPATDAEIANISYLKNRSLGYREHLQTLVDLGEIYSDLYHCFAPLPDDIPAFNAGIARVMKKCRDAENHAVLSAKFFAEAVQHPTDLGVLWMINSSMVIGTEVLRRYVRNIEAYYLGKEYWNEIGFERLFGTCPYPAYGKTTVPEMSADVEPG